MEAQRTTSDHLETEEWSSLEKPVLGFCVKLLDAQLEDLQTFSPLRAEKKTKTRKDRQSHRKPATKKSLTKSWRGHNVMTFTMF